MGNQFALGHLVHECVKRRRGKEEKPLLGMRWVSSKHSCTLFSLLPPPGTGFPAEGVKAARRGVMAPSKLKELATTRPAP